MKMLSSFSAHVLVASAACCLPALAQDPEGPGSRLRIMGLVSEAAAKGTYSFASFDNLAVGAESAPVHARLPLVTSAGHPVPFEVREEAVKIEVLQRSPEHTKYNVVLGPKLCTEASDSRYLCPNHGGIGAGWVERYEDQSKKVSGRIIFHLQQGWAFLWSNPERSAAKTDWVVGGTEGRTMIVEIVDATKQRVYFLEGADITVECLLDSSKAAKPGGTGKFVEVTTEVTASGEGCVFSQWNDIAANGGVAAFVTQVTKIATAAGKE